MSFRAAIRERGANNNYLTGLGDDGWCFGSRERAKLFRHREDADAIAKAIPGEVDVVVLSDAPREGPPMG